MALPLTLDPATLRWVADDAVRDAEHLEVIANDSAAVANAADVGSRAQAMARSLAHKAHEEAEKLRLRARRMRAIATRIETKRRKALA